MNINKISFSSVPHRKVSFGSSLNNNISTKQEVTNDRQKSEVKIDVKSALKKLGAVIVAVVAFLNRKVFSKIGKKIAPYIKKFVNKINKRNTKKITKPIEEPGSTKTTTMVTEKIEKPIEPKNDSVSSYKPTQITSHSEPQRKTVTTKRDNEFKGKNDTLDFDSDIQRAYDDILHGRYQKTETITESSSYADELRRAQDEALGFELFY